MNGLTDTHCHIHAADSHLVRSDFTSKKWHEAGEKSSAKLLKHAQSSGVEKLICVGTDYQDSLDAINFATKHDDCYASVGVHPHEAKIFLETHKNVSVFETYLQDKNVLAIGEVGLDYYYQHSPKSQQIVLLEQFLQLASDNNLPLIFHVRDAFDDFWPIIKGFTNIRGVLHSYTSTERNLEKALKRDLFIGLNGIMTFTSDHQQLEMVKQIPSDKLVLETDAPYLAPEPIRGRICKPEHVKLTYDFLCELREEDPKLFASQLNKNIKALFGI